MQEYVGYYYGKLKDLTYKAVRATAFYGGSVPFSWTVVYPIIRYYNIQSVIDLCDQIKVSKYSTLVQLMRRMLLERLGDEEMTPLLEAYLHETKDKSNLLPVEVFFTRSDFCF